MGLGLGRTAPLAESPGTARPFSRASLARTGEPQHHYYHPQMPWFAEQTSGWTAESSGPSQSPGPAGLKESKILGRSGSGEEAEALSTLEAGNKDLD